MKYKGSCHCGGIAFEAEGEIKEVLEFKHHFCPTCGIHPFAEAADRSGKPMAAINVRSLEGVDPKSFPVKQFDGRAL